MKSKEELKKLFENGDKPTQENFWEWQDSYWHKDEKLPTENTGIYKIKGSVPDLTALHLMNSMSEGDVYNLLDTGDNYVYVLDLNNTGEAGWDKLGGSFIGSFIPLAGTEVGKPLTGMIEVDSEKGLIKKGNTNDPNEYSITLNDFSGVTLESPSSNLVVSNGGVSFSTGGTGNSANFGVNSVSGQVLFNVENANYRANHVINNNTEVTELTDKVSTEEVQFIKSIEEGITSDKDFTDVINPLAFVQKKYVDDNTSLKSVLDNGGQASFNSDGQSAFYSLAQGGFQALFNANGNSSFLGVQAYDGKTIISRNGKEVRMDDDGLRYQADYSLDYSDRSLVDKGYVDSKVSPANLQSVLDSNPIANSLDLKSSITLNPNAMVFNKFATASTFSQFMQMSETLELMRGFNDTTTTRVYVDKGGFKYGEDYSQRPEFNDRSLVDKAYVDSNTQPDTLQTVLDNNGYAISPDGDSTVIMDLNSNQFTSIQKSDNLRTSIAQFSSSINLDSANTLGSSRIVLGGPQISIGTERGIETVNLTLTADNALEYTNDYSSKYTDRTLVDRGYVKSKYINLEGYDSSDNVTIGKQLYFANFNFNSDPATNPNQYFSWIGERGFRYEKGINDGVMDSVASEISEDQFYYSLKKSQPGTRGGSVIVAGVNSLSLSCGKSETGGANPKEGMIQIHDTGRIEIRTEVDAGISLRGLELTTNDSYPVVVIDPITGKLYYRML